MQSSNAPAIYRWGVFRGFQDEFRLQASFEDRADAEAFVKAQDWSLTDGDPITPAVWIAEITPTSSGLTTK